MLRDLFSLFPAYAGVILVRFVFFGLDDAFPRIRGGDPDILALGKMGFTFSPHTRG